MSKNDKEKTGLGIIQVVQIVLIVLKFTNLIDWPWSKVLLPIIICWCIAIILLIAIAVLDFIGNRKSRRMSE